MLLSVNKKQKRLYIHRLVAEAYLNDYNENFDVNHKDENKENNCINNLEMCDRKYNINYGSRSKKQGITRGRTVICIDTGKEYYSTHEAARQLGIS